MRNGIRVWDMCEVRRMDRHWGEILPGGIIRSVLIGVVVREVVVARSRGGSRRATRWDVDDESFINSLSAGIIGIQDHTDRLLGT